MWIYAALLMSVGPVGPGGGVYSIVEVVVYKVYFKKIRFGSQTIMDISSFVYISGPGGGVYSVVEVVVYKFTHETFTHRRHLPIAPIRSQFSLDKYP